MGANGYRCLNLLRPIDGIEVEQDDSVFRYGSTVPNNSPTDFQYSGASKPVTCTDSGNALVFTVTYPSNYSYATCGALPCIALFHAGGFVESKPSRLGTGGFNKFVEGFARRGYVVFNVEYRTGWDTTGGKGIGNTNNLASQLMASYRAAQDIRGFLRSVRKMQLDGVFTGRGYQFDLTKLYLGGTSAGAFTCISAAYLNQAEANIGAPGLVPVLGTLNRPKTGFYYYGADSTAPLPPINGVASFWGAGVGSLTGPADSATFLDANSPPLIGFTGELDSVAPATSLVEYRYQPATNPDVAQCGNTLLYPASVYNSNGAAPDFRLYGNRAIYNRLRRLGIPSELYLDSDMDHGLRDDRTYDTTANFGIANPTEDTVISYLVGRAATFFQAVRSGTYATLGRTRFRDSVNCRYGRQTDYDCFGAAPPNLCTTPPAQLGAKAVLTGPGEGAWTLAPNPAGAHCTIRSATGENLEAVSVYDGFGRLVWSARPGQPELVLSRNLFGRAPGLYLVDVQIGGQRTRQRLLWLD